MAITLTYQPGRSISFGDIVLPWDTDRQEIRKLLGGDFRIADDIIDLSQYNDGDTSKNIIQRRDIYENYKGEENYFFLNFDTGDNLADAEFHRWHSIIIDGVEIDFTMDVGKAAALLTTISNNKKTPLEGEYFF